MAHVKVWVALHHKRTFSSMKYTLKLIQKVKKRPITWNGFFQIRFEFTKLHNICSADRRKDPHSLWTSQPDPRRPSLFAPQHLRLRVSSPETRPARQAWARVASPAPSPAWAGTPLWVGNMCWGFLNRLVDRKGHPAQQHCQGELH